MQRGHKTSRRPAKPFVAANRRLAPSDQDLVRDRRMKVKTSLNRREDTRNGYGCKAEEEV